MEVATALTASATETATATTTTTAAEIAVTAATTTEITPRSLFARTRFVDRQGAAVKVLAVQIGNRFVGLLLRAHLDKTEASRLAGEFVHDEFTTHYAAGLLEQLEEVTLRRFE